MTTNDNNGFAVNEDGVGGDYDIEYDDDVDAVVDDDDDDGVDDGFVLDRPINCKLITVHSPGTLIAAYQLDHW